MHVSVPMQLLDEELGQDRLADHGLIGQQVAKAWRVSISPYATVIWCGRGSNGQVWTAKWGSKSAPSGFFVLPTRAERARGRHQKQTGRHPQQF
jgi:hypothetical protein